LAAADAVAQGLAPSPVVLVALGGYGRAELHPSSDIDVMVIHDGDLSPFVQRITQEILYMLWDLGLQVGHSLRSLTDCVAIARTDFPSRTSMQEARHSRARGAFSTASDACSPRTSTAATSPSSWRPRWPNAMSAIASRRLAVHRRAEYQGVGRRSARRPHRDVARGTKFGARTLRELAEKA